MQVAASRDSAQDPQQGAFRRAPGSSSPSEGAHRGQTWPSQPPRSTSTASAATQDSSATDYARTDSGSSARDPAGVSERRASGAAAGWSLFTTIVVISWTRLLLANFLRKCNAAGSCLLISLVVISWTRLTLATCLPKCNVSKLPEAASVCCCAVSEPSQH